MQTPFTVSYRSFLNAGFLAAMACLALSSCVSLQQPSFQRMSMPSLSASGGKLTISSEAHFNNPNKAAMHLKGMHIQLLSNGNLLGLFTQDADAPIAAMSDFSVPFAIAFDLNQLGGNLWDTAKSMLDDGKLKITFKGYAKVGGKKRGFKIPIIYSEKIKLK